MTNEKVLSLIRSINMVRMSLGSTADLYAGDLTIISLKEEKGEAAYAWGLFNSIPTVIGWKEAARPYFEDAKIEMEKVWGTSVVA